MLYEKYTHKELERLVNVMRKMGERGLRCKLMQFLMHLNDEYEAIRG